MIERNVVKNVEAPRVPVRERKDEVPLEHVRALLEAAKGRPLRALYLLALHAPLRPGELVGAEDDCFDLDTGVFDVRQNLIRVPIDEEVIDLRKRRRSAQRWEMHDTKGHKRREVPLPAPVVQALREHQEIVALERGMAGERWTVEDAWARDDEGQWTSRPLDRLVFPRTGGRTPGAPIKPFYLEDDLKALCAAAGVPTYTPHRLRHAAKTLLTSKGVDPHVVQQLGGWADLHTANLYTGKLTKAMRDAVDALAEDLE